MKTCFDEDINQLQEVLWNKKETVFAFKLQIDAAKKNIIYL
jgi:hypothetical protein